MGRGARGRGTDTTQRANAPRREIATEQLDAGSRLGEYQILEAIARGGFGTVYRAEHVLLGRRVAIKVLHPELATSLDVAIRFEREARAANLIRHPNVVDIYDFSRLANGQPYFVMELLSGSDLDARIAEAGPMAIASVLSLLEPLCGALAAAHAVDIIHRDIKASNVFLHVDGDTTRVVLLDFGVAKMLDPTEGSLTMSHQAIGTPACMAPEQILNGPVDARTDVYGLAALCFHALTGAPPFGDPTITMVEHMHVHARRPRVSEHVNVPKAIDDVIVRGMSRAPADRYADVNAFQDALRAAASPRRRSATARQTTALAVHVEVVVDPRVLEAPDDQLLDDMEVILPVVARTLAAAGFRNALAASTSALWVLALPNNEEPRAPAIAMLCELYRELGRRPSRDERVAICFTLQSGQVLLSDDAVRGGEVLAIASWVPVERVPGLAAHPRVVEGLDLATEPLGNLVRILP